MQLKDIHGQRVLINRLTDIIDSGRVSHAQLFQGETEDGTLALAIAYMQYLCCSNRQHYEEVAPGQWRTASGLPTDLRADACGQCPSCRKFRTLEHPDLRLVFPTTTTKSLTSNPSSEQLMDRFREFLHKYGQYGTLNQWYDELRVENKQGLIREADAADIVRQVNMQTYEAPYKMVLIWNADKMNGSAANELLKTIEEPLGKTIIILTASAAEKLLGTIVSRVQKVVVPALSVPVNREEDRALAELFVPWMRMLFKLDMTKLSAWVEQAAKMGREPQKQFLRYSLEALRLCFLRNATQGGAPNPTLPSIDFGDEKFNQSFYTVITQNNIALMSDAIDHAIMSIERNASPALTFMALSFKLSSYLKKK